MKAPASPAPAGTGADVVDLDAPPVTSWRERAVERSLREARAKAKSRSDTFLAAASALLGETGTPDFTVQQLVERAGMSLRSFYQHFGSKDELLLVLFQEAIRVATSAWREMVDELDDPVEKMHAVVDAVAGAPVTPSAEAQARPMRALALYHLQLAQERPDDFVAVLLPLKALLVEIAEQGVASGAFRDDLETETLAVLVLQTLTSATILRLLNDHLSATPITPEQLWTFLRSGLMGPRALGGEPERPAVKMLLSGG